MIGKTTAVKFVSQSVFITEKILREIIPVIVTYLLPTQMFVELLRSYLCGQWCLFYLVVFVCNTAFQDQSCDHVGPPELPKLKLAILCGCGSDFDLSPQNLRFFKAPRCAIFLRSKIATERRFSL